MKNLLLCLLILTCSSTVFCTPLTVTGEGYMPGSYQAHELIAMSKDDGKNWSYLPGAFNDITLRAQIVSEGANTACSDKICVAAQGSRPFDINGAYTLAVSADEGLTWNKKNIDNLPPYTFLILEQLNCFNGSENESRCVLSGRFSPVGDYGMIHDSTPGFIALSKDNGNNWAVQPILGLPSDAINIDLTQGSCTGEGKNAICVYGADIHRSNEAHGYYMITSTNAGDTWVANPVDSPSAPAAVSCSGNYPSAVCISTFGNTNMINISQDSGRSWTSKRIIIPNTKENYLNKIKCTGTGSKTSCVALGQYITNEDEFVAFSATTKDAGNTWSTPPIAQDYVFIDDAHSLTCAGEEKSAVCAFVISGSNRIFISHDGGNSWQKRPIIDGSAYMSNVTCKESVPNTICIAAGYTDDDQNHNKPILAMSYDAGYTWERKPITGLPTELTGQLVK